MANLINSGILPLTFKNPADYDNVSLMDELKLPSILECIESGKNIILENLSTGKSIPLDIVLSDRQRKIMAAGGLLNYTKISN